MTGQAGKAGKGGKGGKGLIVAPKKKAKNANAKRTDRLFAWAVRILHDLGIVQAIEAANTIEQLRSISLDLDSADIMLAIRDALHPARGERAEHFVGLREGSLKRILNNRLGDLKNDRAKELHGGRRQRQSDWSDGLILNEDGSIKPILANLISILREAPAWKRVLAFDEFNARVVIQGRPPWGEEPSDASLTDHHEALARVWFQRDAKINPAYGDVGRAVQAAAKPFRFHPVRSYFDALVWDGVARLDTWLVSYFHAEDSPYIRAIGPRWIISAVARIFQPGCKVDHCLVFEGPQGKYKSEALRTIAIRDAWFTDRLSHLAGKDAMIDVTGVLIIEIQRDGRTQPRLSVHTEIIHHAAPRSVSPALWQTQHQLAASVRVRRHHQPTGRWLLARPDWRATILAGRMRRHGRSRWP